MIKVFNINAAICLGILNLDEFAVIQKLTSKREIESKAKQFLLNHLLNTVVEIYYDSNGKPHLANDTRYISISHSYNKLVIIVNTNEATGVDVELIRDKITNIKHKFLSNAELLDCNNDVEKLLIYWGAKETLYKIYGLKGVNFIDNLSINSFAKLNSGTIIGNITMPNIKYSFALNYSLSENYVLVYALKKIVC